MTPEKGGLKNDGMGAGGPSPSGEKLSQLLSGGLDKARDQSLGSVGSAFGGQQANKSQNNSVNMSQGSLNMSEKGGGIESSRSGAGPKPSGNDLQDVGPGARSSSAGGVEDLSTWLKYESSKKYEESLNKLALDNSKI